MSVRKGSLPIVVSRDYKHELDACERAVALLLKKRPVSKQGGSPTSHPNETKERSTAD